MSIFKKTKVVMLPTKERSNIIGIGNSTVLEYNSHLALANFTASYRNYHLYFLSDDEIKEGDSNIWDTESENTSWSPILKVLGNTKIVKEGLRRGRFKKIIATTDKSLIIKQEVGGIITDCYLPKPSQEFVKYYCEEGGIDEVMIEHEGYKVNGMIDEATAYRPKISSNNTISIKPVKDSYSREEIIKYIDDRIEYLFGGHDLKSTGEILEDEAIISELVKIKKML